MFRYSVRSMSSDHSESEQPSEKVPLVAVKFDSLAKLLFHRSLTFESPGSVTTTAAGLSGSRDDSNLASPRCDFVLFCVLKLQTVSVGWGFLRWNL